MEIGKRIVELREKRNWSQRELARRADINVSVMNRIETGERPLRADELKKISQLLDVQADYLLGTSNDSNLTAKDERDIAKRMEEIKKDLSSEDGLMFDGEPMSEEAVESFLEAMEYAVRQTQRINKKYIPKKYRDKEND
jgi:transcriptional regulator with XRE-family HTH domain